MALSQQAFTADGVAVEYPVNFPYLSRNHVLAYVNNDDDGVTIDWVDDDRIEVRKDGAPVLADAEVLIYRSTSPEAPLVDFRPGGVTEADLDLSATQSLYLAQEANDFADRAVEFSGLGLYTETLQIRTEVQADRDAAQASADAAAASATQAAAEVVNCQDEVVNAQAEVAAAASHASDALTSENNAAASANAAAAAADSVIWNDVVFLNSADSPFNIEDEDAGRMFAVDASGGPVQINLPSIATLSLAGPWSVAIKKTDSSLNAVTVTRDGTDTIEGDVSRAHEGQNTGGVYIPDTDPNPDQWSTFSIGDTPDGSITAAKLGVQAVETSKIKDDHVTLAKLDHGTQGDVLIYGASGAPQRLPAGTAEHVLTAKGAGQSAVWQATKVYEEWVHLAPVATTSGSSKDQTGLPAEISEMTVFLKGVSFSSQSDDIVLQLGTSGGITTTGYKSTINGNSYTDGFHVYAGFNSGSGVMGIIRLVRYAAGSNLWFYTSSVSDDDGGNSYSANGWVTLAGELDRVRLTSDNAGSRIFDAGEFRTHYRKKL